MLFAIKSLSKNLIYHVNSLFIVLLLALSVPSKANDAGVVLTFDDQSVSQWNSYFSTQSSEVKATFFASFWHLFSDAEIAMFQNLQASGHEIAAHTYDHSGALAVYGLDPTRITEYIDEQIIPSLNNMAADGFFPVSFSFPHGEHNEAYDAAVRKHLPYLRAGSGLEMFSLNQIDGIYHNIPKSYQFLKAEGIDTLNNRTFEDIRDALIRAKDNNEIINLFAHRILEPFQIGTTLGVSRELLDQVIQEVKDQGLTFYTFAEAYQIGNKGSVATQVSGNDVQITWSSIESDFIGIVPIEDDEWQAGMPSVNFQLLEAGDETISIANPLNQQQYRAIFYKNNIRRFISEPFYVLNTTTPPSSPIPLTPDGNTIIEETRDLTLSWNAVPGVSLYEYVSYATDANGVIDYSTVVFDSSVTAIQANCSSGTGVCSIVENIPKGITVGSWKLRSRNVITKGDYSDRVAFSLIPEGTPDTTAPVITLLGSNPMMLSLDLNYVDAGATVTDNQDVSVAVNIDSSAINTSQLGSYEVTYNATDASGNNATTLTRTVIVTNTPTIISPSGESTSNSGLVNFSWNSVAGTINYDLTGYGATSEGDIDFSNVLFGLSINSIDAGCATSATCSISQAIFESAGFWKIRSNSATQRSEYSERSFFTLTDSGAADQAPPIITLLSSDPVTITINTTYIDAGASAIDYVDGTVSVNIDTSAVNTSQLGNYSVVFTASDSAGNTSSLTRDVIVSDGTPILKPPTVISPLSSSTAANGLVTFSWNSVADATSYEFTGYEVTATNSINYANTLFDRFISASDAGCASGGVCSTTANVTTEAGVWKIRSNSDTQRSEYSDKSFFTLTEPVAQ